MFAYLRDGDHSLKLLVEVGVEIILRSEVFRNTRPDLFAATTPSEIGNLVMVLNSESGLTATLQNLRRISMTIHRTWCLTLLVSVSLVVASATVLTSKERQNKLQSEGGAPVPPPPKLKLVAEGGAPVPPVPQFNLLAEGGAPPPPPPKLKLVAEGGAPVPPVPHFNLLAEGGAPVPPPPNAMLVAEGGAFYDLPLAVCANISLVQSL